jgi:sugar/nucleoside kinase (ribokinase family)
VVVLLTDGDRTMLSDRGAAARLAPADLPPFGGADHLHLSGYVLLDPASRAAGRAALAQARSAGLTTSVDPQVAPALGPGFVDDVRGVDLLLPNADELAALGGADRLLDVVGAVAATDGAAPARWTDRDGTWTAAPPHTDVVDPTGAGDAFDAGLLVAWLGGSGRAAALEAGCAAAATAVGRLGARPR